MNPKHSIEIEISQDGQVTATVQGIKGSACSDLSKWLNSLGAVTEDKPTPDFYQTEQVGVTISR